VYGLDPVRVIQAIIAGISFLASGTIFRHPKKQHVEGLTTAASLLFSGNRDLRDASSVRAGRSGHSVDPHSTARCGVHKTAD
jgi:hypothetical protein